MPGALVSSSVPASELEREPERGRPEIGVEVLGDEMALLVAHHYVATVEIEPEARAERHLQAAAKVNAELLARFIADGKRVRVVVRRVVPAHAAAQVERRHRPHVQRGGDGPLPDVELIVESRLAAIR